VLLLSADESFFPPAEAREQLKSFYKKEKMTLPYAIVPQGFESLQRMWGIDGYTLILIKPDGTVAGVDLALEDLSRLID
jgi:hypothetical protein